MCTCTYCGGHLQSGDGGHEVSHQLSLEGRDKSLKGQKEEKNDTIFKNIPGLFFLLHFFQNLHDTWWSSDHIGESVFTKGKAEKLCPAKLYSTWATVLFASRKKILLDRLWCARLMHITIGNSSIKAAPPPLPIMCALLIWVHLLKYHYEILNSIENYKLWVWICLFICLPFILGISLFHISLTLGKDSRSEGQNDISSWYISSKLGEWEFGLFPWAIVFFSLLHNKFRSDPACLWMSAWI